LDSTIVDASHAMIIEVEKGNETTLQQLRDLAARCGNKLEVEDGPLFVTAWVIGDTRTFETRAEYLNGLPGVRNAWAVAAEYKNIARVVRQPDGRARVRERRPVEVRGLDGLVRRIGAGKHIFFVGPDSAQELDQVLAIAKTAQAIGERYGVLDRMILRGGAFKPRTRPTDWRGNGMAGLTMLDAAREETGLPYVTEVMDHNLVPEMAAHADMLQIGTRNAQNFDLHEAVGRSHKPVVLKRGFGNEAQEWFYAAEYIANQGNLDIVLCERGMKTLFTKGGYCRFHPDFNVITHVRKQTILPVIFDPSHSAGDHAIVGQNLIASLGYLVDGTMTETIHEESFRDKQLCDAAQALDMDRYAKLVEAVLTFEQNVEPLLRAVSVE
jgi:3-deoxy-7-phosphoheptulonate synthase